MIEQVWNYNIEIVHLVQEEFTHMTRSDNKELLEIGEDETYIRMRKYY